MIVEAGGGGGGAQSFDAGPAPVALNADGTYYSCALITGFAQNFRDMINTIIQTQGVGCSLAGIVDGATSMGPAIKVELSGNATACSNIAKAIKTQITGSFVVGGQTMCNDVIEYTGEASVANDPTKTRNEVGNKFDFCRQVPGDALDSKSQRSACLKCLGNSGEFADSRIYTAVGCLQTSNEGLVRDLVRLLMGVSGTVALLSILGGAFMLSISQGDTNKVKQGRELIMAAVGGLVFMIFSIIILQFVGVSLLHIPGLSQ
jgi:hypothetical protein